MMRRWKNREEEEENNELRLVEEYHEKIEELKRSHDDKEKLLRHLKSENEALSKKSNEDTELLQEKVLLWEKLKRDLKNLEKEHVNLQKKTKMTPAEAHALRMQAAREGKVGYLTQKEQRREGLKYVMEHGRKIKKHQEWLSKELSNTIENFNEMFINNLSLSLTQIFVDKEKKKDEVESDAEDEEEEEEGDAIFEVEVVNQNNSDQQKSEQIDTEASLESHSRLETNDEGDIEQIDNEKEDIDPENVDLEIEENHEAKAKDKEMQDQLKEQELTIIKIEGSLQEREKLLEAVKESHALMQNSLLEEMKKEYFKKVKEMESEINNLKTDHSQSLRKAGSQGDKNKMEEQYKKKLTELEDKLKHYKVKEKEQKQMEKEFLKKTNKIRVLENDIEKIRNQKATLDKKLRESDDKYRKWKMAKATELVNVKKINVQKDREINELKRKERKNKMMIESKVAELKLLQKRHKEEELNKKKEEIKKRKTIKKVKPKLGKSSKQNVKKEESQDINKVIPSQEEAPAIPIQIDHVIEWIEANVEKMVTVRHLKKDILDFEEKKQQIENEIEEIQAYYSEISIKKEKVILQNGKLQIGVDEGEALMMKKEIEELDALLKKNQESIESLEDKIDFYNNKIITLQNAVEEVNNEEIKGLDLNQINSVQNARTLLVAFFNVILEVKIKRIELEETLVEQHNSIKELEKELRILRESKRTTELQFNRALQQREKDFQELETKLIQEAEARVDEAKLPITTNSRLTSLEAKRMEKKKNEKHFSTEAYEDSKRKLSKMMSELERKLVLEEKKNMLMANMIDQSKAEKEQYKQKYIGLKKKIKDDECNQLRMNKIASMDPSSYNMPSLTENSGPPSSKLIDYKNLRNKGKFGKKGYNDGSQISNTSEIENFLLPESTNTKDKRALLSKVHHAVSVDSASTNVFDRLLYHSTTTSRIKEKPPISSREDPQSSNYQKRRSSSFADEVQNFDQSELLWNCDFSVENAHAGPIYSIATMENQLYTCSKKSLKIWDIDTMDCISDIAAHTGVIRSLCVLPDQKLLASASDKVIMLWDLVSLTNVATLKAHQEDINILQKGSKILVSGGISGFNSPGLYVWDLRASTPIEEREKSDIQCLEVLNDDKNVFIGNSAQLVKRIELYNGPSEALSPPHNDVVTWMTNYRGILVSGSKDKSLRFWDTNNYELIHSSEEAHKNGITCLASDEFYIYSGCKDNIVKSWQFKELSKDQTIELKNLDSNSDSQDDTYNQVKEKYGKYKTELSSYLIGHTAQINSICAINDEWNSIFTGGNDRSLKLWRK